MATMVYKNDINYGLPSYDNRTSKGAVFMQPMTAANLGWKTSMPYDQWQQQNALQGMRPYNYSSPPGMGLTQYSIAPSTQYSASPSTQYSASPSTQHLVYMSTPNGGYMKDTKTNTPSLMCERSLSYDTSNINPQSSNASGSMSYGSALGGRPVSFIRYDKYDDLSVGVL
jgi:hypothetical protein